MRRRTPRRAVLALACLTLLAMLVAPPAWAGDEGHGIEGMTAKDWKGMWGFEKRGFSECWLAGARHQATRTLAALTRLQKEVGPSKTLTAMQTEAKTILECRVTPNQLEEAVNRFYESPGNARVLLGDALHFVVMERCGPKGAR
jgi:hypothetical protein